MIRSRSPVLPCETMRNSSPRIVGLLPETQYDIDVREVPRFGCPERSRLRVIIRPSFLPITVAVYDVSAKGIGLLSEMHVEPGAVLAIFWNFGGASRWRTIRARAVRLTARPDGGWIVGCIFQDQVQQTDVEALLRAALDNERESAEACAAACAE